MKIPNPWPHHQHIRFNVNNGECLGSCGEGPEIEVPDLAVEVLIQAASNGRSNGEVIAPPCIWSKEHGMLDAEDHLKKAGIKKKTEALKARQGADRLRMQDEAKAAEAKKAKDAEPRPLCGGKIDVARAASGLAKVTKALKSNK